MLTLSLLICKVMPDLNFIADGVDMPDVNRDSVAKWIGDVARSFGKSVGPLSYIFCNDAKILEVNIKYLGHDYYTDIITFDYSNSRRISGDMFISLDTVRSNSVLFKHDYREELLRVIIHGVLHLCGIDDKGPGQREIMEAHENKALAILSC